jgi:Ca2+-transporting ATPase
MATGTLGVLAVARLHTDQATALSMAFTTFVLFQLCNALNARAGHANVFSRDQLHNRVLWASLGR